MNARAGPGGSPDEVVATAGQLACLLEVSAAKPGNVSPGVHFADTRFEDFLASAAAIGSALGQAGRMPLGRTIHRAVDATARWSDSNTNLGIVLLLAPIARAALTGAFADRLGSTGWVPRQALRHALRRVLDDSTVDDAREAYAAIRAAQPGGLGSVEEQDVSRQPTVTLTEAMRLAAGRDAVASEYATAFARTFEQGAPALERARADGLSWEHAVAETFLTLLAGAPDTHIARRAGTARAEEVSRLACAVLDAGGVRTAAGRDSVASLDETLRDERNLGNPGATADLTAASTFVVLLGGGWRPPHGGRDANER